MISLPSRFTTASLALAAAGLTIALAHASAQPAAAPAAAELPQFTLFVHEPKAAAEARFDPARADAYWASFAAYGQQLAQAGVMVGGSAVDPFGAGRLVRVRDGKTTASPAITAQTDERLGGYFVIQVKDIDAAIEWAAKCPAALTGAIDVRPNINTSPAMRK